MVTLPPLPISPFPPVPSVQCIQIFGVINSPEYMKWRNGIRIRSLTQKKKCEVRNSWSNATWERGLRWDISLEGLGSYYILWETRLRLFLSGAQNSISSQNLLGRQFDSRKRKTLAIRSYPIPHKADSSSWRVKDLNPICQACLWKIHFLVFPRSVPK